MRGVRLIYFVNEWISAEREAGGRELGVEEFARDYSRMPVRTVYRRLAQFRAAFPEVGPDGTPHHLIEWDAPSA
jgi:hypothetical protein